MCWNFPRSMALMYCCSVQWYSRPLTRTLKFRFMNVPFTPALGFPVVTGFWSLRHFGVETKKARQGIVTKDRYPDGLIFYSVSHHIAYRVCLGSRYPGRACSDYEDHLQRCGFQEDRNYSSPGSLGSPGNEYFLLPPTQNTRP